MRPKKPTQIYGVPREVWNTGYLKKVFLKEIFFCPSAVSKFRARPYASISLFILTMAMSARLMVFSKLMVFVKLTMVTIVRISVVIVVIRVVIITMTGVILRTPGQHKPN
jgi:hypothetical protein